jgi:dihydrodipicolinate synthase/N-acetylneuraminate lyase
MAKDFGRRYDGLYVATVTPNERDSLRVDEEALRSFLRYLMKPRFVEAGGGIIINPEAGEIFVLTREKRIGTSKSPWRSAAGRCRCSQASSG